MEHLASRSGGLLPRGTERMPEFAEISLTAADVGSEDVQRVLQAAGVTIEGPGRPSATRVRGARFAGYLIAHARTGLRQSGEADGTNIVWSRLSGSARLRCVFVFVARGELEIRSAGAQFTSKSARLALVAPGADPVSFKVSPGSEIVFFSFDASEIEPVSLEAESVKELPEHSLVFRAAYSYLVAAASSPPPNHPGSLDVFRSLTRDVARSMAMEVSSRGEVRDLVERAREAMVRHHRSAAFTPDQLARELGVSRRSLERAFARRGMSVSDELRRVRATHALRLLETEVDMPIEHVAATCGFRSQENLRRAVVKFFGAPPTVLRRDSEEVM